MCIIRDKQFIIEHILLTCSDFIEIRKSHFTAQSLHMLFQDCSPEKIFNFLKEINILRRMSTFRSVLFLFIFYPLFRSVFKI